MPDLDTLVRLFYDRPEQLGEFRMRQAADLPPTQRKLLAHHEHMTETVETHHDSQVRVEVLQTRVTDTHYARKILLRRTSDDAVVQFGIVRLNVAYLSQDVRDEIVAQKTPLGRVLIEHDVMRQVELVALWEVNAGSDLRSLLNLSGEVAYGRTALIHCNGEPAVELLEIVTP